MAKNIVITGASDGIGAALARRLLAQGHTVSIVGRSPAKTAKVAEELGVKSYLADFTRLVEVRQLADAIRADNERIDVLINNAGTWWDEYALTEDGFERTLQVNLLAPALLTELLRPALHRDPGEPTSIAQWTCSTSSRWVGKLDVAQIGDSPAFKEKYRSMKVYGSAKLAAAIYVHEFENRFGAADNLASISVHPGMVATNFGQNSDGTRVGNLMQNFMARHVLTTPDESAARLQFFCDETAPGRDWLRGEYYEGKKHYAHKQVADPVLGAKVWDRTRRLLGLDG